MVISSQKTSLDDMTYERAISLARALAPAIAKRAAVAEVQRCQPTETIQEIIDAELVRLLTPARWGGHELSFNAFADSTIEIAKADGSAGWCYALLIAYSWVVAHFPEEAQRDVWANDPNALIAMSGFPSKQVVRTDGGYLLSGNWPWTSGIDHCSWCILGGLLPASGDVPPESVYFLVPKSDYEILDTWFVAGQKATGTNNVVIKEAFVPEHRMIRVADIREGLGPGTAINTGPLYSAPFTPVTFLALVVPLLGATIGAYEIWRNACRNKVISFSSEQVAAFSHVQIRVAKIEAEIQAARLFLQHCLDVLNSGHSISLEQRFRFLRDYAYIAQVCVQAMEQIFLAGGASASLESNPLQRHWRDIHVMATHAGLNFESAGESFGAMELGLPPKPRNLNF
jgi:3-hydroxy-9,10-secoandrosta-1,3,5(10)-triene-9,17-dione monooxygenase